MKNIFKLGFLAFALILCLSACDFFSQKKSSIPADTNQHDSVGTDSIKKLTDTIDTTKVKADSIAPAN
jgi:outer membrane lipopolysaccharide assembly protein LptE/RlpB